jgi:putative transposase
MKTDKIATKIKSVARITEFDKIQIKDVEYIWDCDVPGGKVLIETSGSHRAVPFTDERIQELLDADEMMVTPGYHSAQAAERRGVMSLELITQMDPANRKKAMHRLTWVELILEVKAIGRGKGPGSDATMEPLMDKLKREYIKRAKASEVANGRKIQITNADKFELKAPSARTLRNWVARYLEADGDISGLMDNHKGIHSSKYTAEERNLHAKFVLKYVSRTKPTIKHLHRRMVATFNRLNRNRKPSEKLRPISETWLRRKINALPSFFKMAGREGQRKARLYFQSVMAGMDRGVPFQRVEADEWTVDVQALLAESVVWDELTPKERKAFQNVRLYFSGVIDVATKTIPAFRCFATAPTIESAYATIELTTRDKTHMALAAGCRYPWEMRGRIRSIGLDSAVWFTSDALKGALLDAGCRTVFPPAGEPYLRGTIERFFRTIAFLGLMDFSGKTFSNVVEKGGDDPAAEASVRVDLLIQVFTRLIVDVYHNTPHAGLGGLTPRQAWLEMSNRHGIVPPPTGWERRNMYGIPIQRKITKQGIVFDDIQFQSPEIQAWRREDKDVWIDCKVDRFDLSEITAIKGDAMFRVPAVMKGLKGVTIWQWKAAKERLRVSDRQHLEFTQAAVDEAIEWAADQADIARAELELGTPVLTGETLEYLEAKMDRFIKIVDVDPDHQAAVRNQIALRPELRRLFGITSTLKEKVEMTPGLARVLLQHPAFEAKAEELPPKAKRTRRKAVSSPKTDLPPPDDEFGMPE